MIGTRKVHGKEKGKYENETHAQIKCKGANIFFFGHIGILD